MTETAPSSSREALSSRLGFILLSAGCAIGLGNVWRFPYICGAYGGALFLLIYFVFLVFIGFPIMVMELAIGRGGQQDITGGYDRLKNPATRIPWKELGRFFFVGNLILLMFYTVITGWMLSYTWDFLSGNFADVKPADVPAAFTGLLGNPGRMLVFDILAIAITVIICISGLKSGVERVTKVMMLGLFLLMLGLAGYALSLDNGVEGLKFFLMPKIETFKSVALSEIIHAALMQAFFTLSLGIGSIAVFGSYIGRQKSLSTEASIVICLDTFVAVCAGLIIFPCCTSFGVKPDSGPGLVFITLPRIFTEMQNGRFVGSFFFLFMSIAALTTLVAVAENLVTFCIDQIHWPRKKATLVVGAVLLVASLPCLFGFNAWSAFQPLGKDTCVLDLEDFIVSDNLLPLGALTLCLFCTSQRGWGFNNFLAEANSGTGAKLPKAKCFFFYVKYLLPAILLCIWGWGIILKFAK